MRFWIVILIFAFSIFHFSPVHAASLGDYFPIVGKCTGVAIAGTGEHLCTVCDFFTGVQRALNFVWWYGTPILATIYLAYGGIKLLIPGLTGGSVDSLAEGRKIIYNALIGILIIFFAWVAIDTIIKALGGRIASNSARSGNHNQFGPWNKIDCTIAAPTSVGEQALPNTTQPQITITPNQSGGNTISLPTGTLSDQSARAALKGAGITWNHDACPAGQIGGCTDLEKIRSSAIAEVINFKSACEQSMGSCPTVITGGTEKGVHTDSGSCGHVQGCKLDIVANAANDAYIQNNPNNFNPIAPRSNGDKQWQNRATGAIWARESNPPHWDVSVQTKL